MDNREKIIRAIEKAKRQSEEYAQDIIIVPFREADMILSLLKEQEAVEPKKGWFLNDFNIPQEHWFCGKCDEELVGNGKYCANCGQGVKRE